MHNSTVCTLTFMSSDYTSDPIILTSETTMKLMGGWINEWVNQCIPRFHFSGRLTGSLAVLDRVQRRSWGHRDPNHQTWPQTGRGRWWWCMELNTKMENEELILICFLMSSEITKTSYKGSYRQGMLWCNILLPSHDVCIYLPIAHLCKSWDVQSVDVGVTWVDLAVVADAIGINDALKARGELVGFVEGGWRLFSLHSV